MSQYLLNPSRCVDTLKDLTRFWLATKVPEGKDKTKCGLSLSLLQQRHLWQNEITHYIEYYVHE